MQKPRNTVKLVVTELHRVETDVCIGDSDGSGVGCDEGELVPQTLHGGDVRAKIPAAMTVDYE
jgi:hypothetical protein